MNNEEQRITIDQEIALVINAKYSIDDQIAILRQKGLHPDAFEKFNAFAEEVKAKVKPHEPTKEEKIEALDYEYSKNKATLIDQYNDCLMHDDAEGAEEIKEEMAARDAKYDADYEEIMGEE